MLIVTEDLAKKFAQATLVEIKRDQIRQWVEQQARSSVYIDDPEADPTLIQRQIGRPMTPAALETKLQKVLGPNYQFEFAARPGELNPRMKQIWHSFPDGRREKVCLYHNEVMPEHSVMTRATEDLPDATVTHLDRKDLPKTVWTAKGYEFDDTVPIPGMKRTVMARREAVRGWRTVLLRLVLEGHASVNAVEREFGADNRREWATKTGKKDWRLGTPW